MKSIGLGRLARRISAWTTNSLLTVILLLIALCFGRQVLHWWHDEPAKPAVGLSSSPDPLGDRSVPHVLEFGDQACSIRRQEFSGRPAEVLPALQGACRTALLDAWPRGESPDTAEQDLLRRLASEQPVAEQQGQWRLYQWGGGYPVLIGTRTAYATLNGESATDPAAGTSLAKTPYRVVLWGVAVPAAKDAWTLYLFQSGGQAGGQRQAEDEISLPPDGHRLVSIRAAGGGAITAFAAESSDATRKFYDRWFADHGWTVAARWRPIAAGWQARFETRESARAIDIRLGTDSQGRASGLVVESFNPEPTATEKSIRGKP